MSRAAITVSAAASAAAARAAICAGCEEEGVPTERIDHGASAADRAVRAARASSLGIGIGIDEVAICVALATWPGRPYLSGSHAEARTIGQDAARIAARRPLTAR